MNILVIDDEPLIHISIEKLILSCSPQDQVFHAYNGHQMLDLLNLHDFALAYVDIKMPGISGLEAIKIAKETSPSTQYYIMTGFDEFEYAKQAVKLKVDDFLMKPLDNKIIKDTVSAAREHMKASLEHKKNLFRNWLESTLNQRDSFINSFSGQYCSLFFISLDSAHVPIDTVKQLFGEYYEHLVSLFAEDGLILLCFSEKSSYILEIHRKLLTFLYPTGITCFVSSITSEPLELKTALFKLFKYASLRVILGLGHFYHLAPLMDTDQSSLDFCQNCLSWKKAYLSENFSAFSNQSELILHQLYGFGELKKHQEQVLDFIGLVLDTSETLPREQNALKDYLKQISKGFIRKPSEDSRIQAIIQFIQEHYRENISAADLSEHFELSASYISNMMKNALGIKYNDYITQLRLRHAKELLVSTRMSVKEISTDCGYFSQSHFSRLFLEYEGCTPLEYRKAEAASKLP